MHRLQANSIEFCSSFDQDHDNNDNNNKQDQSGSEPAIKGIQCQREILLDTNRELDFFTLAPASRR